MRLLVISDSHGRQSNVFDIISAHIDDSDYVICLGDCNSGDDFNSSKDYFGNKLRLVSVCGNCDWYSKEPEICEIKLFGKKIMMCHGHTLNVKMSYLRLIDEAKRRGVDIALFGHTHNPYYEYSDGLHIMNPGAANVGCYGMIDITDSGIVCIKAKLN